jgi:lipoprotein-releasing system permease protein
VFELTVARRHIFRNPRMAFFTVLSVALAVAIIVVMMGMMEGFKGDIINSTVENNPHVRVDPKEDEKFIRLYRTLSEMIRESPGVEAVSARLKGNAAARHKDKVRGVSFIGVDPEDEAGLMKVGRDVKAGDFMDLKSWRLSAFLGVKLAQDLHLEPEESFYLVRQNKSLTLKVAGLIETGTGADQSLVYLPLKTAQEITGKGDVVSEVGVRISDIYQAKVIASELNGRTRYQARSWQDLNADLLKVIETQSWFALVFYVLIFAIAGFGIANTMIMIITRRTKEVGILMAMGASQRSIMRIFILESVIMSPPAAALGCALGWLTAKLIMAYPIELPTEIYRVSRMTVAMKPELFLYAVVFAVLVNFVAGIYPAWRASKLDPVEAIATA